MEHRRRGRPPHPDILTPREWEVLELLHRSLSNEEIAELLEISVPGAKYHLSQILSKLHVSSRAEAAAWRPDERRRRAWLAWPLATKAAGVLIVAGALAAIAVLAFGTFSADDGTSAPDPERDRALLQAARWRIRDIVDVQVDSTDVDSRIDPPGTEWFGDDMALKILGDGAFRWEVSLTGWFDEGGSIHYPDPNDASFMPVGRWPNLDCRQVTYWYRDGEWPEPTEPGMPSAPFVRVAPLDDSACTPREVSRDLAVILAARWDVFEGNVLYAKRMTIEDAFDQLAAEGALIPPLSNPHRKVWLVSVIGQSPLAQSGPNTLIEVALQESFCKKVTRILAADTGGVIAGAANLSDACA